VSSWVNPLLSAKAGNAANQLDDHALAVLVNDADHGRLALAEITRTFAAFRFSSTAIHGMPVKRKYHHALPDRLPRYRWRRLSQVRKAGMKRLSQLACS
jgi:hypothetical protein